MRRISEIFLIILGFTFFGLGSIGVLIPGLPTVPFMILALACFAKSSNKFYLWLYNHKLFGNQLKMWEKHKVIPPMAKIFAIGSMIASITYMLFFSDISVLVIILTIILMAIGAGYIITKPNYPPSLINKQKL